MMFNYEQDREASIMTLPRRLDYFPPITSPATMFQRRKKKSARELYELSPEDRDVLGNPPTTPWAWDDSGAEFFGAFIGTRDDRVGAQDDDEQHGDGSNLRSTTWPFLRQLGPRCVFRGMRKKTKCYEGPPLNNDVHHKQASGKIKAKAGAGRPAFNKRFIEPECIGMSRELTFRRHQLLYDTPSQLHQKGLGRQVSSSHFKDASQHQNTPRSLETSPRGIQAPPPSGRRIYLTEEVDDRQPQRTPPVNHLKSTLHSYGPFYNSHHIAESARRRAYMQDDDEERVVRFEQSPLPEKLRHLTSEFETDRHRHPDMSRLTWQDIVQAPVIRLGAFGFSSTDDGDTRHGDLMSKVEGHVSFRLPKSKAISTTSTSGDSDDAASSQGREDKRSRGKGNDNGVKTWTDDVRTSHRYVSRGHSNFR